MKLKYQRKVQILEGAPKKISKPELCKDMRSFAWDFKPNRILGVSLQKILAPLLVCVSSWKPPVGHPNLIVLLRQVENEIKEIQDSLHMTDPYHMTDP